MTESEAYLAALRILTRGDRSEADLRRRLQRRGLPDAQIEQALQRCRELGYIDDQKFARQLASQLHASGRAVGPRLSQELVRRGFDRDLAALAAAEAGGAADPLEQLLDQLRRRYPELTARPAGPQEKRRVVAYFQRRGHAIGMILDALERARSGATD